MNHRVTYFDHLILSCSVERIAIQNKFIAYTCHKLDNYYALHGKVTIGADTDHIMQAGEHPDMIFSSTCLGGNYKIF